MMLSSRQDDENTKRPALACLVLACGTARVDTSVGRGVVEKCCLTSGLFPSNFFFAFVFCFFKKNPFFIYFSFFSIFPLFVSSSFSFSFSPFSVVRTDAKKQKKSLNSSDCKHDDFLK